MIQGFFESRSEKKNTKSFGPRRTRKGSADCDFSFYRERGCDGCSLLTDDVLWPKMKPTGQKNPRIYVLGEAPGKDEDEQGKQFVGRSGRLLRNTLHQSGLSDVVRFDNCCRCRPKDNRTPEPIEIERCRNSVIRSIERAKPEVLMAVGGVALYWALGERSITSWHGRLIPIKVGEHVCWLYPILHPSFILRPQGLREDAGNDWRLVFRCDIERLATMLDDGLPEPPYESMDDLDAGINYATTIRGLQKMASQLANWEESKTTTAFDIETKSLRPYNHLPVYEALLSIAISDGDTTWAAPICHPDMRWNLDGEKILRSMLVHYLSSRAIKVAHNLSFEQEWLSLGLSKVKWRRSYWGDTQAQSYTLCELPGIHELDLCCLRSLGFRLKSVGGVTADEKKNLAAVPMDRVLRYNAFDAKYTAKTYHCQADEIRREGLQEVYRMQIKRTLTLVKAQQKGLLVDNEAVVRFQNKLQKDIDKRLDSLMTSREARLFEKKTGKKLNLASPPQLVELFRDILGRDEGFTKKNKTGYSVDVSALEKMDTPFAKDLLAWRNRIKLKETYVDSCKPKGGIVYVDGRIHTNFNSMVTVSGRLSSSDPNNQNWPKRKDAWIRSIIIPPITDPKTGARRNHIIVSCDYGQIEPRVIAMASKDRRLCDAIRHRYDIHKDWAERIASIDNKTFSRYNRDIKKLRQDVKSNWVLAGFYGAIYASISARLGGLNRKCERLFDDFKSEFSGVWAWQEEQLAFYNQHGYVVGLTGRRRHAPLTTNQILNNPTQGVASDIVVDSMNRLSVRADREDEPAYQSMLNIHDDLTFYLPVRRQEELTQEIVREMLTPQFDWINVPLSVEVAAGMNWCDLETVGTFFSDEIGVG